MKNKFEEIQKNISKEILKKDKNAIVDGIINCEKYAKATTKILWVLKEPNSSDSNWTYQDFLSVNDIENKIGEVNDIFKIQMFSKVFYSTYGLKMNEEYNKLPFITEKKVYQIGEEIAYINIKKVGGGSNSNPKEIENAYKKNEDLLLKQIKEYNPNIIIFGNTHIYFNWEKLKDLGWDLSEKEKVDDKTNNTDFYSISKDKLCIIPYHPASRRKKDVYCSEIIKAGIQWREKYK